MDNEARAAAVAAFDADNSMAVNAGIFGLPFGYAQSEVVLCPVPWEVTVSYGEGTALGPQQVFAASPQLDLWDAHFGEVWKKGIFMLQEHYGEVLKLNGHVRKLAKGYIAHLEQGATGPQEVLKQVNEACHELKETVKGLCLGLMDDGRKVGMVGGDHSCPLGYMEALADRFGAYGILQIDAHADLRAAYEGFTYSHASIMHNVLAYSPDIQLVQVGIRDYSAGERARIAHDDRIRTHFDADMKRALYEGGTWANLSAQIIDELPHKVYVSLDVDGLQPALCPATGTPVPGGLDFDQVAHLLYLLGQSGRQVIGFDLSETGNGSWDGVVSARLLYKLCGLL
ncbi:MAG: agmatinase family protein [Bacteroidetes bacterium]|nr:agmatinase family protein [Bacteroidota bacterium]